MPNNTSRDEYTARINRVMDYIDARLDRNLSLDKLAEIAHFSKFHFHRIFKAFNGETVSQFVLRLRLQKATKELTANPLKSITEIAFDSGFSAPEIFSRSFKAKFNMSPSQWRYKKQNHLNSKNHQALGNNHQENKPQPFYIDPETNNQVWMIKMEKLNDVQIEVKNMPKWYVAYLRHTGPYKGDGVLFESLLQKLMTWAGARNLLHFPETKLLSVYHDDPEITDDDKQRISVCLTITEEIKVDGNVGKLILPAGKFAVGSFEISDSDGYEEAWNTMMAGWLPDSGFQPDDRLCYEIYKNDPNSHAQGKHLVDICIPIKPL